jgi:hypothetical protein
LNRDAYWDRIKENVNAWQERWMRGFLASVSGDSHLQGMPKLVFVPDDDQAVVYDSRFDEPVKRQLSDTQARILEYLSSPRDMSSIHEEVGSPRDYDVLAALKQLTDWGLLFQEDSMALSLVEGSHAHWETMTAREMLSSLEVLNLKLWIENGKIKFRAAPEVLTDVLRQELAKRRSEILRILPEIETLEERRFQVMATISDLMDVDESRLEVS